MVEASQPRLACQPSPPVYAALSVFSALTLLSSVQATEHLAASSTASCCKTSCRPFKEAHMKLSPVNARDRGKSANQVL